MQEKTTKLPAYGVVIGTYDHSDSHVGTWLHELIYLRANGTIYQCAVDVNEPNGAFQYMLLNSIDPTMFANISSLADGYHDLVRNSTTGAVDYIRSPFIQKSEGCLSVIFGFMNGIFGTNEKVWKDVTGDEAGNALAAMMPSSSRVFVFGAPYADPNPYPGMHDVHMNQGDPIAGPFHHLDGTWQDGCVIILKTDNTLAGYFGKFTTQSLNTDSNGFPV